MTDQEISKALALAIGWAPHDMDVDSLVWCCTWKATLFKPAHWKLFDYRDPTVIWPIAERYDCFPYKSSCGCWTAEQGGKFFEGATAAKAVALAVICQRPERIEK